MNENNLNRGNLNVSNQENNLNSQNMNNGGNNLLQSEDALMYPQPNVQNNNQVHQNINAENNNLLNNQNAGIVNPQNNNTSNNEVINGVQANVQNGTFSNNQNNNLSNNLNKETVNSTQNNTFLNNQNNNIGNMQNGVNGSGVYKEAYEVDRDEELLRAFIGKNYDKITSSKFNFAGFFFTIFYMLYRKMFCFSLGVFFIWGIISEFIDSSIANIILCLCFGFFVNKIYLFYANRKIQKIKQKNAQKSFGEIRQICELKGGTSVGLIIVGILAILIFSVIIVIIATLAGVSLFFGGLVFGALTNSQTYNGVLVYDSTEKIVDKFSMTVPTAFKNNSNNFEYDYSYETGTKIFNECSVSLKKISNYTSSENLINQMSSFYLGDSAFTATSEINGIKWKWFVHRTNDSTKYYYGTEKNGKVYLFEYDVERDADINCENYKQQILNSINEK